MKFSMIIAACMVLGWPAIAQPLKTISPQPKVMASNCLDRESLSCQATKTIAPQTASADALPPHWVEHDHKSYSSLRAYGLAHRKDCNGNGNCCAGFQDFLWGHWHGLEGSHTGLSNLADQADADAGNNANQQERDILSRICETGK